MDADRERQGPCIEMERLPPIDFKNQRYPACIVWTPIPMLTWIFPFIGHMGICTTTGIIRDFAGPYCVSTDCMAFGAPTRYKQLDPGKVEGGFQMWDSKVLEASEIYKGRMHNLFCDNCHSHVGMALNLMQYDRKSWNMVKLAALLFFTGNYVGFSGILKSWVPFLLIISLTLSFLYVR